MGGGVKSAAVMKIFTLTISFLREWEEVKSVMLLRT